MMLIVFVLFCIAFLEVPAILFSRYTRLKKPKLVLLSKGILLVVTLFTTLTTFDLAFIERPALEARAERALQTFPSYNAVQSGEQDGIYMTVISTDIEKQVRVYNQQAAHHPYLRFAQETLYYRVSPDLSYTRVPQDATYFIHRTLSE